MNTEILRIIEGGLTNDKRKVISYSNRLADRLSQEGDPVFAACIRKKIEDTNVRPSVVADALRNAPLDLDSRLQIVEVIPPAESVNKIILNSLTQSQIEEFVNIVRNSSKLEVQGLDIPKTLILYGQPGCGKTSIAHYISNQTGLPLILARLDSLVSSLLGSTAKNIRKIFDYAGEFPSILFLDEFDAIAKARDDQKEIGELKRVINSLLQNMDAMPKHCVLIAATNHPELLDRAVWRRFLQKVEVKMPKDKELVDLIRLFCGEDQDKIADLILNTKGMINLFEEISPSDMKNLFDRAKVKGILEGQNDLSISHLLFSIYELQNGEKSEDEFILYLKSKGLTQRAINELTGISLRKIKCLTANK
ncbi:AAA family ATPase [Bacteroides stercoris]|jgi:AAA+ superfamily predicted ATPase|uniref:AAA family ATPase n=1 Tax=Bacteroides stercoris TaxID=46506 RepID=UPI000E54D9EB|nr:ATP-binding protein [Bacteroides stercoris]RHL56310.1 AAA family ATPase [Bacteroides stercoris]